MANPFYTYSGAFIPGTLARAEQVGTEYTSVQAGFAILAIQGTDSGAANAYVVTTNGGPSGAYADGNIVEFKAVNANTGLSTINVNGIGVVNLTSSNGQTLASGAMTANTWYRALYNSTYSAWTIVAPTSLVTTSNTIAPGAPTNKVGLTAAGGTSLACVPIDATYALDQGIVPTWTGAHVFSSTVTFNSTVTFANPLSLTGGSGTYAATLTGSSSAGNSRGLLVKAGVNVSDICLLLQSQSGGTTFFTVGGTGGVQVGAPTGGDKGVGTINAQNLYVQGAAVLTVAVSSANPSATIGLSAVNGSAGTFMTSDSAPPLSQSIAPTWTGAHVFTPSSAVVAVTLNGKINTTSLVLSGATNTSNTYLMTLATGQGAGFSSGLLVQAGTNSSDYALVVNAAVGTNYFIVYGDGESIVFPQNSAASAEGQHAHQVGYTNIPLIATNSVNDYRYRGYWIDATSNVTISANGSVAYPIGTTMMIYNTTAGNITIAVTTDTLTWIPSNTNGTRTLAAKSLATIYKRLQTTWLIWGFGLS